VCKKEGGQETARSSGSGAPIGTGKFIHAWNLKQVDEAEFLKHQPDRLKLK